MEEIMLGLMAKKMGMTQIFDEQGNLIPVTVLCFDPNIVIAQKNKEKDGYNAVVLGVGDKKKNHITKPYAGQFPEGIIPKKYLREICDFDEEVEIGAVLGVEVFEGCRYVDVVGVSKGKGFQGVMKRHGFQGGRYSHGSKFHREPGSTGQSTYPGKTFKNMKLPGRMGRERVTVLSQKVVKIDTEKQFMLVHGAVPGVNENIVLVRTAIKK
jgi:large subunit ribosomal protein L3